MRRIVLGLILPLLLLAGCSQRAQLPGAPPAPVSEPAGPPPAPSVRWAPPIPAKPGSYLFAVDLKAGDSAVLLERPGKNDFAYAASPDGRYVLFLTEVQVDPPYGASGRWEILDRSTGKVIKGPQGMTDKAVRWSGRGFWTDPLTHVDLQGHVDSHEELRQHLALAKSVHQIAGVAWQADGSHVALVIKPVDGEKADLVWATAAGDSIQRVSGLQPWFGKQGYWTEMALSPDGKLLYLRGALPGAALIRTDDLAFDQWRSLDGEWTAPGVNTQGGGAPATAWSPDGRFLLEGARRLFDREGTLLWHADPGTTAAIWLPDGSGFLWTSDNLGPGRRFRLDGQSEPLTYAINGQVLGWLPDGRLLVALMTAPGY